MSTARTITGTAGGMPATARLTVLACPAPLCPHVEFAVAAVLGVPVGLRWVEQPAALGSLTATAELRGAPGLGGRVAARLLTLGPVRYEVLEDAAAGVDAERHSYTPDLGLFRTALAANGDVTVTEGSLRALLDRSPRAGAADAADATLAHGLERLLGTAWDEELEPLRRGGDGAPVSWLRRVG